jgi:hypothetical protein
VAMNWKIKSNRIGCCCDLICNYKSSVTWHSTYNYIKDMNFLPTAKRSTAIQIYISYILS